MYFLLKRLNSDVCRLINEYANDKYIKIHKSKQILVNIQIKYRVPYINHVYELKINNISDTMV